MAGGGNRPGARAVFRRCRDEASSGRIFGVMDVDASTESQGGRAGRFLRRNLPMVAVVLVVLVAVVFVASDRWRRGALIFGGAALLGAALRLFLPTVRVGLLAVRSKPFDVGALTLLGSSIVFLAVTINTLGVG